MLNTRLPKTGIHAPNQFVTSLLLAGCAALLLPTHQCQSYQMQHEPVALNEINLHHRQPVDNSSRSREVTNLRLIPELRSIRLRWDYERAEEVAGEENDWPASFRIRFCELTSWQAEIKCRQRDMRVQQRVNDAHPPAAAATNNEVSPSVSADEVNMAGATQQLAPHDNSTVIQFGQQQQQELVRVVAASDTPASNQRHHPSGRTYEAQIFDLRALTSYTFNVQVLRFMGDGNSTTKEELPPVGRPARRLDLGTPPGPKNGNELESGTESLTAIGDKRQQQSGVRVETKPFSAEALKCLANSSEVLVNTGRYFGGRISVESANGAPPAACQLLGNRSSPQSSYLFRIDHELCRSKVLDSQRIETMILVHENKDLLTHNTARFLVQCYISQRSFTVRASVSLPKVNGLTAAGGEAAKFLPATVTAVASPQRSEEQLRLGSMPGVFRLIRANPNQSSPLEAESQQLSTAISELGERPSRVSPKSEGRRRESKELQQVAQALAVPRPVDVSSGVLFVGRKHDDPAPHAARAARLLTNQHEQIERVNTAALIEQQRQQPIVMTNNHRVAGDFLPLTQAVANLERARSASGRADDPFSIKYSPESVSEYPLAKMMARDSSEGPRVTDTPTASVRSRSGRMRQISDQQVGTTAVPAPATSTTTTPLRQSNRVESRMGESRQATRSEPSDSMSAAESSIENRVSMTPQATSGSANHTAAASGNGAPPTAATSTTLAQNITGALLRWSLKTLGNLARKSLDALASEAELAALNRSKSLTASEMVDANEQEEEAASAHSGGRSAEPAGAIIRMHEGELDGFMVERRKTTEKPGAPTASHQGQTKTATTASTQQQQVRAATQSADLRDSRIPHQLEAPPGPAATTRQSPPTTTASIPTTSTRPTPRHRSAQRARLEQQAPAGRTKLPATGGDDASLLPPSEDPSAPPGQANTARASPTSSLWPVYCLWSLVGLLGSVSLAAFLLVSNRGARAPSTSGSFQPSSHHQSHSGSGGILAQLNDAIQWRHTATSGGGNEPPPGLPPQKDVYVQAKQQARLIQSPSVQRRDLTLGSDEPPDSTAPNQTQRHQFANVSHAVMSPGGGSAASTRSTSAASTANMSSRLGSGSANIVFSNSSSDANSMSSDHHRNNRPAHESYCKNHEQFVYTDHLLLSDSDCLTNDCRGESFA